MDRGAWWTIHLDLNPQTYTFSYVSSSLRPYESNITYHKVLKLLSELVVVVVVKSLSCVRLLRPHRQ